MPQMPAHAAERVRSAATLMVQKRLFLDREYGRTILKPSRRRKQRRVHRLKQLRHGDHEQIRAARPNGTAAGSEPCVLARADRAGSREPLRTLPALDLTAA